MIPNLPELLLEFLQVGLRYQRLPIDFFVLIFQNQGVHLVIIGLEFGLFLLYPFFLLLFFMVQFIKEVRFAQLFLVLYVLHNLIVAS